METLDTLMEELSTKDSWGITKPMAQADKERLQQAIQNTAIAGEQYLQNVKDAAQKGTKLSTSKGAPGIVNKLQGMLSNDIQAINSYDPAMELSLPQLLETARTKTLILDTNWRNASFGDYFLYVKPSLATYCVITSEEKTYVLNVQTKEDTESFTSALKTFLMEKGYFLP